MNKAANLVANAILGDDLKVVILGSKAYTIQSPTIAVICKSIKYLSCIDRTTTGKEELSRLCRLSRERGKNGGDTKVIGNETMMGQIATFMETLKLTYNEIVYRIPYRNLLLMQKDILHQVTGDLIIERDGRYLLNRTKKEG